LVTDEQINLYLTQRGDVVTMAASDVAANIAVSFARRADRSIGPVSISYRGQAEAFRALSEDLRRRTASVDGVGMAPITSSLVADPIFDKGMHDYKRYTDTDAADG
jgi:hypothetical protein